MLAERRDEIPRCSVKVRIASDLHCDFQADGGARLACDLGRGTFDVLVVAGDLTDFPGLRPALLGVCEAAAPKRVVYVLGNHEEDGGTWEQACEEVNRVQMIAKNLTFLERATAIVEGQRFVGCTLWYPRSRRGIAFDQNIDDRSHGAGIGGLQPEIGEASASFLARTVRPGDIVVTHHLPHPRSVAARHAKSPFNSYFLHDVSNIVEGASAALWIHGHTHVSCNYTVGATRVVCNPFGYARSYPGEPNPEFRADLDVVV